MTKKVAIGFLTYGQTSRQYLDSFLSGLKEQTFTDFQLLALDNTEEENSVNVQFLRQQSPAVKVLWPGTNLGFGAGFNRLIKEALALGAEYFLVVNADTFWTPRALELLVAALDRRSDLGSVSPKILKWDFAGQKFTKIIDTCGLRLLPGLHFVDLGQGEEDKGQYDSAEILGPSGAAGLFRLSALAQSAEDGQYFDEKFFMYKEDCDLAYRLKLKGWPSALVSQAIVYHDRTASGSASLLGSLAARSGKSQQVKLWSFSGQQRLIAKYWARQTWFNKLAIIWRQFLTFAYALVFEPALLKKGKK